MELRCLERISSFTSVEGNIGAGKSFLVKELRAHIKKHNLAPGAPFFLNGSAVANDKPRDLFVVIDEPDWSAKIYTKQKKLPENEQKECEKKSILSIYYDDPEEMALGFQINALTSRIDLLCECVEAAIAFCTPTDRIHVISERSLLSDALFFRNLYESGMIYDVEYGVYCKFYKTFVERNIKKLNTMILVNTGPEKCEKRIQERNREAETQGKKKIPLSYLQSIHNLHLEMIDKFGNEKGHTVINLDFEHDLVDAHALSTLVEQLMFKLKQLIK